MVPIYIRKIS